MTNTQPVITAIERQERRRRYNVFVDGAFALALSADVLAEAGLHEGDPLTPDQRAQLEQRELRHRAMESAVRLLSYRPRSEQEMTRRLRRKGLPDDVVRDTVDWLRDRRYLDDREFARFWTEQRGAYGSYRIRRELAVKGVDREAASEALQDHGDEAAALLAGQKKARTLGDMDYLTFRNRVGSYLQRRGFSYQVSRNTVNRLWRERQEGA